jgi:threonine dehydrogenase-like Zn-dependent dehydrogenase
MSRLYRFPIFFRQTVKAYSVGMAMMKNLTVKGGNCNHLRHAAKHLEMVRAGVIKPERILTKHEGLTDVLDAYRHFDKRESGWIKVELRPAA